ncbi:MAG: hypothetical protein L0241_27045, partial [Planctomycetia bacterium]|nr:hypothetical protein [Planctomycetia bacterium]
MSFAVAATAPHPDDTIVAVSSASGSAPRAIVRVSGPKTKAVVESVFVVGEPNPPTPFPRREGGFSPPSLRGKGVGGLGLFVSRHLIPGSLRLTGVHSPLPATLYFFAGPRSYTGQDLA